MNIGFLKVYSGVYVLGNTPPPPRPGKRGKKREKNVKGNGGKTKDEREFEVKTVK
jgi:hypothetical protein